MYNEDGRSLQGPKYEIAISNQRSIHTAEGAGLLRKRGTARPGHTINNWR